MLVELKLTNRINERTWAIVSVCPNSTTSIWQPCIVNCILRESRNSCPNSYFIFYFIYCTSTEGQIQI